MSSELYAHDVADSDLYKQSLDMGCALHNAKHAAYTHHTRQHASYGVNYDHTRFRGLLDTDREQQFRTDQFDLRYRCPPSQEEMQSSRLANADMPNDDLGYACNKGFMYELDSHNTYHNYIVCKNRDTSIAQTCCPENIQIFNNITRRTIEQDHRKPDNVLFVEDEKIPTLTYSQCMLPRSK